MKTYKILLLIATTIILKSCGSENQNQISNDSNDSSFSFFENSEKTNTLKDTKSGLIVSTTSYPSNWQVITKADYANDPVLPYFRYQIKDDEGMLAFNSSLKICTSTNNRQLEQIMRSNGTKNLRPLQTPNQLLRNEIASKLKQRNFSFQRQMTLPELAEKLKKEVSKNVTDPFNLSVTGSIWENNDGQKAFVILNYLSFGQNPGTSDTSTVWLYNTDLLISKADNFENNIKKFIKATLAAQPTSEWDNYSAQVNNHRKVQQRKKMQESITAHRSRMASQDAAFNAHQRKMNGIYAANDASNAAWMERNFSRGSSNGSGSSNSDEAFLNYIKDEETVYNPGDGNSYQIQAGAKETWMDNEGNYINSNDVFFDPNASNTNNTNWTKVWEDY